MSVQNDKLTKISRAVMPITAQTTGGKSGADCEGVGEGLGTVTGKGERVKQN